jgi:hypothetical protein
MHCKIKIKGRPSRPERNALEKYESEKNMNHVNQIKRHQAT